MNIYHKMEAQKFCQLFSSWIFVFCCPSVCVGLEAPRIDLKNTVFVAFAGEDLRIQCNLIIPANQTDDILTCSDPLDKPIYHYYVPEMQNQPHLTVELELKRLEHSGEYVCRYKTAEVFWFLYVRDDGYQDRDLLDYSHIISVAVFTVVLLVFSIVGSAFVLRGYWKERSKERKKNKEKQCKEERKETQMEDNVDVIMSEDNVDVIMSPSTSFYATLEPRPRSIYDALDRSTNNTVPGQSRAKPTDKVPQKKVAQTLQTQQEDESVYENF